MPKMGRCGYCDVVFEQPKGKNKKYCCHEHYALSRRNRVSLICAHCHRSYETTPSHNPKYCCMECAWQAQIGQERPYLQGRPGWTTGLTKETDKRIARMAQSRTKDVPTYDDLYDLYTTQNKTLEQIGKLYGATRGTVSRWISSYRLMRKRDMLTSQVLQRLTAQNLNHTQIAQMYNCCNSYVSKFAKQHGIKALPGSTSLNPDKDALTDLYLDQGLTLKQVGDMLGMDATSVQNWLRKYDIPTRSPSEASRPLGWTAPSDDLVCDLYVNRGLGLGSIVRATGAGYDSIKQTLLRHGIALHPPWYTGSFSRVAKDGHIVRSGLELQVDNWLFEHCIPHEYETKIGNTRYLTDFVVGDWCIEIWGLDGIPQYDQRKKTKLEIYKRLGLKLLSIYPKDFPNLDVLNVLLEQHQLTSS